jgi:hypothetical protein
MREHVRQLELSVNARSLRLKSILTAINLDLTLAQLARAEGAVGNLERSHWASESAKDLHLIVQEFLLQAPLTNEEKGWIDNRWKELQSALDLLPSFGKLQFALGDETHCGSDLDSPQSLTRLVEL